MPEALRDSAKSGTALIFGNAVNAYSLLRTLDRVGWSGDVLLVRHQEESQGFAECISPKVKTIVLVCNTIFEVPAIIDEMFSPDERVYLFFTDERYHLAFAMWREKNPKSHLRAFLGSLPHMGTVLDRLAFYRFVESRGLAPTPRTIAGDNDPFAAFGNTFLVRPRCSWVGVAQRERVQVVRSESQYLEMLKTFSARGVGHEGLCYQELLSVRDRDNVSVCGWFGPVVRHLFCTRKVLQWPPHNGSGDLVERISAPNHVVQQTVAVLTSLKFDGPFEMEFVFDTLTREFRVIELNPRFWLQHGLIEALTGSALVSTYLGRETLQATPKERSLRYWVNPLYSLYRLLRFDARSCWVWLSPGSWAPFTFRDAIRYALHYTRVRLEISGKGGDVRS